MKNSPIYKNEFIKEKARIDCREEKEMELKLESDKQKNKYLARNTVIGIFFLIFMYYVLIKPIYIMIV